MVSPFYSPMLQDKKLLKSLWSSGLKAVNVDGVDFKDLSSLGRANISDRGEFHVGDCCPLSN